MDKNIFGWETNKQGPVPQIMQHRSKGFADDVIFTGGRSSGKTVKTNYAMGMNKEEFQEYLKDEQKGMFYGMPGFDRCEIKPWPSKETACTKCQAAPIYENHMCLKCETEHVAWLKQPFDNKVIPVAIQPPKMTVKVDITDHDMNNLISDGILYKELEDNTELRLMRKRVYK